MLRFLVLTILIFSAIVAATYAGAAGGLFPMPSALWPTEGFLMFTSILIFRFLSVRVGTPAFTQSYLLSVVGKIGGFGIFMLIVIVMDGKSAPANVVLFMVSYALLTAVEILLLFKKVNR